MKSGIIFYICKKTKFAQFCEIFLYAFLIALAFSTTSQADSLDRALIKSLAEKNYMAAENLLKRGANPEAFFGSQLSDNAVCTAIDDRSSKYLELLMKYGASANAHWDIEYEPHRTPLACSVYLLNFEAFDLLLDHGADPSVELYEEEEGDYLHASTALTIALSGARYPMALRLVTLYPLHPAELRRLVFELENRPYDQAHPWNKARDELIEWTRERVPTLNPRPASPRSGTEPDCLFSFRDHEEGLKKGTICWESDEK